MTKYRTAFDIPSERYKGAKIYVSDCIKKVHVARNLGMTGLVDVILKKIGLRNREYKAMLKNDMNPLEYWHSNNHAISAPMDAFAGETMDFLREHDLLSASLLQDIWLLYSEGSAKEKTEAITVLAAMKRFVGGINNA